MEKFEAHNLSGTRGFTERPTASRKCPTISLTKRLVAPYEYATGLFVTVLYGYDELSSSVRAVGSMRLVLTKLFKMAALAGAASCVALVALFAGREAAYIHDKLSEPSQTATIELQWSQEETNLKALGVSYPKIQDKAVTHE